MGKIINNPQDGEGITREYYIFIRILSFLKIPKIESKKMKLENRLKELKKKRYRL